MGVPLKNGKDIIKSRVDNGYILGAFSEGELIGNITFFQTTLKNIENSSGWSDITSNGTFDNFISDGDTLCCPAVSSKNGSPLIFTPSFFADAAWYYKKWAIQLLEKPFEADSELKKMI